MAGEVGANVPCWQADAMSEIVCFDRQFGDSRRFVQARTTRPEALSVASTNSFRAASFRVILKKSILPTDPTSPRK